MWEELVENLTNPQRFSVGALAAAAAPEAQRLKELRYELFCRLFANPHFFQLRHDLELAPGITWFSRACRAGDVGFVRACIDYVVCDINKVYSNKSTPLLQAIVGNQLEVVTILCECPDVDPFTEGPGGVTALDFAKQMKRDGAMLDVIMRACEAVTEEAAADGPAAE